MKRTYSTQDVAQKVGIHLMTLHRWLHAGVVQPSIGTPMNDGRKLWRWTDEDVAKVREYKRENYRRGSGPKPKSK